ncbi:MAG: sulfatase-like hydrolase/transferase [Bacilli bacterium]|nr:sulfatase-like hydrolase/transferase [Bacilli bacterium]
MKTFLKNQKLSNAIIRFIVFLVSILFLEFMFIIFIFNKFSIENVINILFFSVLSSFVFSIITGLFKTKGNNILTCIILFALGILYSTQLVFYNIFKVFFSFEVLGLGDQLESFASQAFKCIFANILYILTFMLPFIIYLAVHIIFRKKIKYERVKVLGYVIYILLFGLVLFGFIFRINKSKGIDGGLHYLYNDINSINLNIEKIGVLNSYTIDVYRIIFGFEEKIVQVEEPTIKDKEKEEEEKEIVYEPNVLNINFDKPTSNGEIKKINDYMKSTSGSLKNEYTGIFKGYNLIYITAESFSEIGVSEELTPTLYKLTHTGFVFDNYYTPNVLSTIGGEFQSLTGLFPDGSILKKWRNGTNYFPYGLATTYKKLGYNTYAYHDNWYGFQDRHKYIKTQGFTNYLGCGNGLQKRMNCKTWPGSDDEMMKVTIPDYINSDKPFMAYYMTVSGHFAYTFDDNYMAYKNRKLVSNLKLNENAKAYVATQIELDRALKRLLQELEKAGKLDNTVIVLLADHYPYALDLNTVNSLSTYKRDAVMEVNHNNLILWNSKIEETHIKKPCMSSDVLPTVYNLFGIDYDSRLFTGRDIMSTNEGLVVFSNHSWITDKGRYYSNKKEFIPYDGEIVDENYVKNTNAIVNNRLNVSKLIIKNDYYRYLFN